MMNMELLFFGKYIRCFIEYLKDFKENKNKLLKTYVGMLQNISIWSLIDLK